MKLFTACALLLSAVLPVGAAPRVFMQPNHDPNAMNPISGQIVAQLHNGSFQRLSHTKRCWNLKHSPDGKSWAWTEGETVHLDRGEKSTLFPTRIVIWHNGAKHSQQSVLLQPDKTYDAAYIWNGSNQLAVISCGRHGVPHSQLFDARSGRCLQRITEYDGVKLPAWTRALPTI